MRATLTASVPGAGAVRARAPATPPSFTTAAARSVRAALVRRSPRRAVTAAAAASSGGGGAPKPMQPPYPGFKEEHDVSHEAFMKAFTASHPVAAVPGLQQFAAALLDRRRSIPSAAYADPLDHIFAETDADGDGLLSAAEVAAALQSRGVDASAEIVGRYIRCARDAAGAPPPPGDAASEAVARGEFAAFVLAMASADLHHHGPAVAGPGGGGGGHK